MNKRFFVLLMLCICTLVVMGQDVINRQKKQSTAQPTQGNNKTFMVGGVSFTMVYVEGGTFTMGGTSEQGSDADIDEKPTHSVTLSSYYIGETEVTQGLWQAVMGSNPSEFTSDSRLPVENVSWEDCQNFISRLNSMTGQPFKLPTEAQWEYAARGGSKSRGYKYSGSNDLDSVAWFYDNCGSKTHPVKTKQPNELGLYDMSGNVYEWCQDWYGSYSNGSQTNPAGLSSGSYCVQRGGCWVSDAWSCRLSSRDGIGPTFREINYGLRLVLPTHPQRPEQGQNNVTSNRVQSTAVTPSSGSNKSFTVGGVSFTMVYVQGGTFTMGATSEQGSDAYDSEKPTHSVTLSDYYIGETEVTQGLWQAVMGSLPSDISSFSHDLKGSQRPVCFVSWEDCQTFISKLNSMTDQQFKLPTEAQWEYAARGGSKSRGYKYSGSNDVGNVAWYTSNANGKGSHDVKTMSPNELGIYDMSGNVWEWCQDWYGDYNSGAQTNPTGPSSGSDRVIRGGGWVSFPRGCRLSCRSDYAPSSRFNYLGLRLAF